MSKPRVFVSPLTGRAYYTSDYRESRTGHFISASKQDVTDTVVHELMAAAWARGWNECNAASEGETPSNPYRPAAAADTGR